MNTPKVLTELEFGSIIGESGAQTQTGAELITKYRAYILNNPVSCATVNQFVREASAHTYDQMVCETLRNVTDYIQDNRTSWALASACENINARTSAYSMLDRNASRQVEKLLEQDEPEVVRYIRSGALKNVMYCEAFRSIARNVFQDQPMVDIAEDYTRVTPISFVEELGEEYYFVVASQLYKATATGEVMEANWTEVSDLFKTINTLLSCPCAQVTEQQTEIVYNGVSYIIQCPDQVTRTTPGETKVMTTAEFREQNRLQVLTANPRKRTEVARMLESIALLVENYADVATMDNAAIYTTAHDKFVVIRSNETLLAKLIRSDHKGLWSLNQDPIKTLEFIKDATGTDLAPEYQDLVQSYLDQQSADQAGEIEAQLKVAEETELRERIEKLTEAYKNDPVKLAILSKLASELNDR